jgi:type IV pilus assembly protein PilX
MTLTRPPSSARGIALITALVFLVVLTLLGVTLMEGITLEQRMAHNLREKQRAIAAADAALNGTASWLSSLAVIPIPTATQPGVASPFSIYSSTDSTVSTLNFASDSFWASSLPQSYQQSYPFDNALATSSSGITIDGGVLQYASDPKVFLVELPTEPQPGDNLAAMGATYGVNSVPRTFQLTAWATGGTANAVAVVQETYRP